MGRLGGCDMPFSRRGRYVTLALIVVILALGIWMAMNDPLRDLTTNHAELTDDARDPRMRPRTYERPAADVVAAARTAAGRIGNWEYVGDAESDGVTRLLFVRTSRLWKFKDDVTLRVEDLGGGRSRVTGESRSRVGKGDLGQNPRNLRRILGELELVLGP